MSLIRGLKVDTLSPLDEVRVVKNEASISSLGTDNYLAYLYYMNLVVHCLEEDTYYQWRTPLEDEVGLLASHFTYPAGIIEYGIDYSNLVFNFFPIITANSLTIDNVGTGVRIFKNITFPTPNTKQFNLRSIKIEDAEVGISLFKEVVESTNEINIKSKVVESNDIIIDYSNPNKLVFKLPNAASALDFYIQKDSPVTYLDWFTANANDNGGTPIAGYEYKGKGTQAKPFVDTVEYTLGAPLTPPTITANTAVETAKLAYIGFGTALNPQFGGRRIRLRTSSTGHVYTGLLNVNGLVFTIETGAELYHNSVATSGENAWLVNLDHSSLGTATVIGVTIELEPDSLLSLNRNGFKNKGTNILTNNFSISKQISIKNNGGAIQQISSISNGDTPGDYIMFDTNAVATSGFKNDGNGLISMIGGRVLSLINPIFKGGIHVSDFTNVDFGYGRINGDISTDVIPFSIVEGAYVRMENCKFYIFGNQVSKRVFQCSGNSLINLIEPLLNGTTEALVEFIPHATNNALDPSFTMYNSTTKDGFTCTVDIFKIDLGARITRWVKGYFNNNYLTGSIDETKIDLTGGNLQGVVNFIGRPLDSYRQVHYSLPRFGSRAAAVLAVIPKGSMFINTNGMPVTGTSDPSWKIDIVI